MAKFVSIFLTAFFFHGFLFIPAIVNAEALKLSSISVKGNSRLSDEAVINYSRLVPSVNISSEDLNAAYAKILDTGLFKNVSFSQDGRVLTISVDEYPFPKLMSKVSLSIFKDIKSH